MKTAVLSFLLLALIVFFLFLMLVPAKKEGFYKGKCNFATQNGCSPAPNTCSNVDVYGCLSTSKCQQACSKFKQGKFELDTIPMCFCAQQKR